MPKSFSTIYCCLQRASYLLVVVSVQPLQRMNDVSSRIEPAVAEFIEREFLAVENAPLAAERLAQIHYALFVEGKTLAEVRAEFPSPTMSDEASEPNVEVLSL